MGIIARPAIGAGILYLGIVSTAGAFVLWTRGLRLVDAGRGGLYFFFQPLVGTMLGWFVLAEPLTWAFGGGAALIVAGIVLVLKEP